MAAPHKDRERMHLETRAQWRAWLAEHHASSDGVWLVWWRQHTGRPAMSYEESVQEALCFGWIDSKADTLDDDRSMMWFSPRKRGSGWSRPNKLRVERLVREGLMAEAGLARIKEARRDGSWTKLDAVWELVVPDDLAAAFADHPGSHAAWDAFPPSARRAILEWILQARRPETRARRVAETARLAAQGRRANEWRPSSPT
jgi:uncharacterized protein YdeI (YjbR/CyaY-like superfamily)